MIIPQLLVIGQEKYDIVTSLTLQPGETIPDLHIFTFHDRIKIILEEDGTFQTNSLTET